MHNMIKSQKARLSLVLAAAFAALSSFAPSVAHAEKNIDFTTSGSVAATLVFSNQVVPDVYTFFARAGQTIRLETSNTNVDTTIRVIGPDASISLFDDDGGAGLQSLLQFTAADSGAYIVVVSSFSGNPVNNGAYTLSFTRVVSTLQAFAPDEGDEAPAEVPGESNPEVLNPSEEK
jgi:pre-peptidase